MSIADYCKQLWVRSLLRGVRHKDRHQQLDMLYRVSDPWGLDCERERARFAATNRIITREYGLVSSILEIGCGEGLQSQYLSRICTRLTGLDISERATKRARTRCSTANFFVGDIMTAGAEHFGGPVQLVVACEVLYYVSDVREFLGRMSALGDACLVTYYAPYKEKLQSEIYLGRSVQSEIFRFAETEWIIDWWRNDR